MNFHNDEWIMRQLNEHYKDSLQCFPKDRIVCLALQGSQNYELDTENSDVDSRLIVTPSFEDFAMNKKAVSTTHIRKNNEHIDFKDIRVFIQLLHKQNINILEILFTPYVIVNPLYAEGWDILVQERESIARLNPYRTVKAIKGMAYEKIHSMEHPYPSKKEILDKFSYDPKQLHHILRLDEFLNRYISKEPFSNCLKTKFPVFLSNVKEGIVDLEEARILAENIVEKIVKTADNFCEKTKNENSVQTANFLEEVQLNIIKIAMKKDLGQIL